MQLRHVFIPFPVNPAGVTSDTRVINTPSNIYSMIGQKHLPVLALGLSDHCDIVYHLPQSSVYPMHDVGYQPSYLCLQKFKGLKNKITEEVS